MNNILLNAVQAMPGGGMIRIQCDNFDCQGPPRDGSLSLVPGSYVRFTVSDEGPGIAPELMPVLFAPFVTAKADGYGLGPATRSIVTRHGGCITVEPREPVGTTFTIYLPAFIKPAGGDTAP